MQVHAQNFRANPHPHTHTCLQRTCTLYLTVITKTTIMSLNFIALICTYMEINFRLGMIGMHFQEMTDVCLLQ